jgi:organic hydroperoxide reductase OsmC/OhrA
MIEGTKVSEHEIHVAQLDAYRFEVRFDKPSHPPLLLDEPPPLGHDAGPNASRVLAAAIGNCLAASLLFCLGKSGAKVERGIEARVQTEIVRTPARRLRIGKVAVTLIVPAGVDPEALRACSGAFEDFCTVTASVRAGIDVTVQLQPAES